MLSTLSHSNVNYFVSHCINNLMVNDVIDVRNTLPAFLLVSKRFINAIVEEFGFLRIQVERTGFKLNLGFKKSIYMSVDSMYTLLNACRPSNLALTINLDGLGRKPQMGTVQKLCKTLASINELRYLSLYFLFSSTGPQGVTALAKYIIDTIGHKCDIIRSIDPELIPILKVAKERGESLMLENLNVFVQRDYTYLNPLMEIPVKNLRITGLPLATLLKSSPYKPKPELISLDIDNVLSLIGRKEVQEQYMRMLEMFKKEISSKDRVIILRSHPFYQIGPVFEHFELIMIEYERALLSIKLADEVGVVLNKVIISGTVKIENINVDRWVGVFHDFFNDNYQLLSDNVIGDTATYTLGTSYSVNIEIDLHVTVLEEDEYY